MKKGEKMDTDLENLLIYRNYVELTYYSYQITKKFPKTEIYGVESDIKRVLNEGLENIILAQKSRDVKERIQYLNKVDCKLKSLKFYVRLSYKSDYITGHNYGAWSRKIASVSNMAGGWLKACLKH